MKIIFSLIVAVFLLAGNANCQLTRLAVRNEWKYLEYSFPNNELRQDMIHDGSYEPVNLIPLDVDVYLDQVFLTLPSFRPGVPVTLTTLSTTGNQLSPLLDPFPNWHWYLQEDRCEGITSVFRIKVDECGRLWVLDSGVVNVLGLRCQACPAQLLVFDLKQHEHPYDQYHNIHIGNHHGNRSHPRLIRRHVFAKHLVKPLSVLTNLAVDIKRTEHRCVDTFVYIADAATYAMIVYDAVNDRSWRISSASFWPSPHFIRFRVAGDKFFLPDGIVGMALSPKRTLHNHDHHHTYDRTLFYTSAAANTVNYVHTANLQDEEYFNHEYKKKESPFSVLSKHRKGQGYPLAMSSGGVMFYSELIDDSFRCWNISRPFKGQMNQVVDRDHDKLQFISGIKAIINSKAVEEIWVVSNKMQKYIKKHEDTYNEVNFRILRGSVDALVAGTTCA